MFEMYVWDIYISNINIHDLRDIRLTNRGVCFSVGSVQCEGNNSWRFKGGFEYYKQSNKSCGMYVWDGGYVWDTYLSNIYDLEEIRLTNCEVCNSGRLTTGFGCYELK